MIDATIEQTPENVVDTTDTTIAEAIEHRFDRWKEHFFQVWGTVKYPQVPTTWKVCWGMKQRNLPDLEQRCLREIFFDMGYWPHCLKFDVSIEGYVVVWAPNGAHVTLYFAPPKTDAMGRDEHFIYSLEKDSFLLKFTEYEARILKAVAALLKFKYQRFTGSFDHAASLLAPSYKALDDVIVKFFVNKVPASRINLEASTAATGCYVTLSHPASNSRSERFLQKETKDADFWQKCQTAYFRKLTKQRNNDNKAG